MPRANSRVARVYILNIIIIPNCDLNYTLRLFNETTTSFTLFKHSDPYG